MLWEYSILLLRTRISCRNAAPSATYKLLRKKRYTPGSMHLESKFTIKLGLVISCRKKVVYINNKEYFNVKLKLTQFIHFERKFTYLFHHEPSNFLWRLGKIGFGVLGVECWPLVPKFAGSNPAEAVGFLGRKNHQHAFLRRGSKAVGPMS